MSYQPVTPEFYQMFTPDTPWHAGAEGWSVAPVPGWGDNPNLVGPPLLAMEGLGAYYRNQLVRPIAGLGAYYRNQLLRPISGLGCMQPPSMQGARGCGCAKPTSGLDEITTGQALAAVMAVCVGGLLLVTAMEHRRA